MNRDLIRTSLAAALVLSVSGLAIAQETPKDDKDALKGPSVQDDAPGSRKFTQKGVDRAQAEIPMRVYVQSLNALRGDAAAEDVRLTADQDTQIKAAMAGFQADIAKFRETHESEIRELMAKLSPEDRRKVMSKLGPILAAAPGARNGAKNADKKTKAPAEDPMQGDPMQVPDAAESAQALDRLKEIGGTMPQFADAQSKMWGILTEGQRAIVQKELDKYREEQKNKSSKNATPAAPGQDPIMDNPRIPQEMKDKLKDMTPEQRREAVRKWREQKKAEREQGDSAPKTQKPAPGMDEVDVPAPEEPK